MVALTPYLISYVAVGLMLTISAWLHKTFARGYFITASAVTLLFWPLLILLAPEIFFQKQDTTSQAEPKEFTLMAAFEKACLSPDLELSDAEAKHVANIGKGRDRSVAFFAVPSDLSEVLRAFWDLDIPPAAFHQWRQAHRALKEEGLEFRGLASRRAPDWFLGFSNEFVKSVAAIDRKLQGRILEAINKISDAPITPLGDTLKPLSGDLSGFWRYRIGDDRLVYFPHPSSRRIILVSFGGRGSIYDRLPSTSDLVGRD